MKISMQKITPHLCFDHQAEEAVNEYVSIFKNSKILNITRYAEGQGEFAGTVRTIRLWSVIEGRRYDGKSDINDAYVVGQHCHQ